MAIRPKRWRQKLALFVRNLTYLGGFRWRNRNQNHQNMNLTYLGEFWLEKYDAPSILFPVFNPPYPQGIKKSWYCKPDGLGPLTADLQISFHHLFSYMTFWNYIYFTWKFQNYSSQMMVTGLEVIIWPPENDPSDRLCQGRHDFIVQWIGNQFKISIFRWIMDGQCAKTG